MGSYTEEQEKVVYAWGATTTHMFNIHKHSFK